MHINTKVVFEWDQDKQEYLEVYSEGYEYSGDLILARTGYQGYQSLWDLSQGGGLADYLKSEFGIGSDYKQYITPFEDKPFEFLEAGLGLEQEALGYETTTGLREVGGAADTAYRQSNMANVGGITKGFEQQKDKLMTAYGFGMEQAQLGYEIDVYGERDRQEQGFYDDIAGIIQMKQG